MTSTRSTIAGLLLVVMIAGGVYLARSRKQVAPPSGQELSGVVGEAGLADPAFDPSLLPDVTLSDATATVRGVRVTLAVASRPATAFGKTRYRVRVESNGAPAVLEGGRLSFEMPMPMGEFTYSLVPSSAGWAEAEVVLPLCPSGNPRWYVDVSGSIGGSALAARFRVDLAKPTESAPSPR